MIPHIAKNKIMMGLGKGAIFIGQRAHNALKN
jgi:hypothetical protein